MKERIDLFLKLRSYSAVARAEGVDPATIRKQMQNIDHELVQALVKKRSHQKYTRCEMCGRPFGKLKLFAKGQCQACYKYFDDNHLMMGKRLILTKLND
jgi:protein-arginine kinase activator protein McsA